MGKSNYAKSLYDQYEEVVKELEDTKKLLKENNKLVSNLNELVKSLNETIDNLKKENEELKKEVLRLKAKDDKNSSNSSKPSSTNGYKKVITNRREKSGKSKGAQKNHEPHSLNNKLEQFINSGNVEEIIVEVNKNEKNKNKRYVEKAVIDIKIVKVVMKFRYYPDKHGKYNIPKCHNQNVQYGNNIKAMCVDLTNHLYNSMDGVTRFIEDITNGGMTISKGTLCLWQNEIANKLSPEIENIEFNLLKAYYINHDESQIKVNGDGYNILCACNRFYTRLWVKKHKSIKALEEINFLPNFKGIIVKDGTELYNLFGILLAQCLSHILRYLKGIYEFNNHIYPKKMKEFLSECNTLRNEKIENGITSFSDAEYQDLINEYDSILDNWENELRNDTNNYLFNDELKLFTRMKYDNKKMDSKIRGDRDEILYFLKDFKVPATNNQAEVDQRNAKIKQKTGKWRSLDGANNYAVIRSCINTYKKNDINVYDALISAFDNHTVIV